MIADFEARLRHGGPDGRRCEGVLAGMVWVRVLQAGAVTRARMREGISRRWFDMFHHAVRLEYPAAIRSPPV
jgi:hypothetical protein